MHYLVLVLCAALLLSADPGYARTKEGTKATGAIDAATFDVLMKAQELTEKEQYNAAVRELDKIKNSSKLNSYAKSQMWNFYAYIYSSQEKYREAIAAYKKIIAEPDAPEGLKLTSKYTLAQLYFQIEDYDSVISFMSQWLKQIDKPTSTAHIMLAQAYFEKKSYDLSLKNLNKAIQIRKSEGEKVDENWLRMKAAIYYDKDDMPNTLASYKELNRLYPKVSYLKQIAGLYSEVGDDQKRLTTFDSVYLYGGLSSESDVLNLVYMYLGQDIPYKAGKILEKEMNNGVVNKSTKNYETLANAWAQANEHKKAIPTLETAAKNSNKGLLYARLAGVYFDAGDFAKAAEVAKKADQKGGLKSRANNQMLLGMALFNTQQYKPALQAFRQAKQSKKSFSDARKWERYTLSELERLKQIEESAFTLKKQTEEALDADENNLEAIGIGRAKK